MAEEYQESEMSKIVKKLMDEEGFEFGEAVKEAMRRTRKDVAGGGNINYTGNMMRSNYAMGSEDIPEMEEMASDEYRDLLKSLNAPTEDQASGIMGLNQGAPSIKMAGGTDPMLLREYEQYVFEMQEMGREPMDLKSFIRQLLAEARMGVRGGGRIGFADGTEDMSEARQFLLNKKYVELLKKYSDAGVADADSRALKEANEAVRKFKASGGRMNYAQGTPKLMGNPAVVTEIKNMRENQIMNPDVEDVADYKTYYKKLKAQDEEIKRMLDKAKKEKQKRAKGGIAGVL